MKKKEEVMKFLMEKRVKLGTVSGILTTKPALVEWVDKNIPEIELITSKSYQVNPNKGNRAPIIVEPSPGCTSVKICRTFSVLVSFDLFIEWALN